MIKLHIGEKLNLKCQEQRTKLRNDLKTLVHETQKGFRRITRVDECVKLSNFQDT